MPYNSSTSAYERRAATVIDATPDGDTVAVAIDVKLDQGIDDYVTDLNHHAANGNHFPETSVGSDSRFLKQSPAGVVSWADGVVAADAALKDFSNVASGAITSAKLASVDPAKVTQNASNRFVTDAERSKLSGIEAGAEVTSKAKIEAVLTGEITSHSHPGQIPSGTVAHFAMASAPAGWLKANGAAISRTTYSALFGKIGTTFGSGDGSTTFNIPDLRGYFPRAWDDGRGIDSGRVFGSTQADQNLSHTHTTDSQGSHSHSLSQGSGSGSQTAVGQQSGSGPVANTWSGKVSSAGEHTHTAGADGGAEARPKNIALLYCIKY